MSGVVSTHSVNLSSGVTSDRIPTSSSLEPKIFAVSCTQSAGRLAVTCALGTAGSSLHPVHTVSLVTSFCPVAFFHTSGNVTTAGPQAHLTGGTLHVVTALPKPGSPRKELEPSMSHVSTGPATGVQRTGAKGGAAPNCTTCLR